MQGAAPEDPVHAEVVLGRGARIRIDDGSRRRLELLAGTIFVSPGPDAPPASGPLRVVAGPVEVDDRGARFSVGPVPGGGFVVALETGVVVLRTGDAERTVSGPCRVEVPAGRPPEAPVPAEASDASSWFAHPVVALSERVRTEGGTDLVVELTPSVPREIRIAPFHARDPLFALLATHAERGQTSIQVNPRMLRAPPPAAGPDGSFLLSSARPYRIEVDVSALAELDTSVHVSDLSVPENVVILTAPEVVVAHVAAPRIEEELAAEEAAAVEAAAEEAAPEAEAEAEEAPAASAEATEEQ